jgi:hypothetical protein
LTSWEGSVTWRNAVASLIGGGAVSERGKEETIPVELTQILLGQKIKKNHVFDSPAINGRRMS